MNAPQHNTRTADPIDAGTAPSTRLEALASTVDDALWRLDRGQRAALLMHLRAVEQLVGSVTP
jgi:hypothetical protein